MPRGKKKNLRLILHPTSSSSSNETQHNLSKQRKGTYKITQDVWERYLPNTAGFAVCEYVILARSRTNKFSRLANRHRDEDNLQRAYTSIDLAPFMDVARRSRKGTRDWHLGWGYQADEGKCGDDRQGLRGGCGRRTTVRYFRHLYCVSLFSWFKRRRHDVMAHVHGVYF